MRKLKALKVGGGPKRKKKSVLGVGGKLIFPSCYFFITPFPLYCKEDF
jgi:hypothetical protein